MAKQRKTSAKVAKTASKLLRTSSSTKVKRVAASTLSQRAPQPKKKTGGKRKK